MGVWGVGCGVWGVGCGGPTVHDGHETVCCRFRADIGARVALRPITQEVIDKGGLSDRVLPEEEHKRFGVCRGAKTKSLGFGVPRG